MKLRGMILLLLALVAAPAFAQEESAPPAEPAPEAPPPVQQDAQLPDDEPIIVGKQEPPPGPPEQTQPNCECCGIYFAQSPTRVEAVVIRNGGPKENANYESIACMLRDTAKEGMALVKYAVLDYATAGTENEEMLEGEEAYYVYGTRPIPGSSAPYIAAFEDEGMARGALEWLEGKAVLDHGELLKRYQEDLAAAAASGAVNDLPLDAVIPPGEDWFVCPCAGGCCDHIRSDDAGVCPDCGLELVRRTEKLRLQRQRAGIRETKTDERTEGQ